MQEGKNNHGGSRKDAGHPPQFHLKEPDIENSTLIMVAVPNELWKQFQEATHPKVAESNDEFKMLAALLMVDRLRAYIEAKQKRKAKNAKATRH